MQKSGIMRCATMLLMVVMLNVCAPQDLYDVDFSSTSLNCTTTDNSVIYYPLNTSEVDFQETLSDDAKKTSNISHLKTSNVPKDWEEQRVRLTFPELPFDDRYKMTMLHLDKGFFIFDFLRVFLSFVQPYDLPVGNTYNFLY